MFTMKSDAKMAPARSAASSELGCCLCRRSPAAFYREKAEPYSGAATALRKNAVIYSDASTWALQWLKFANLAAGRNPHGPLAKHTRRLPTSVHHPENHGNSNDDRAGSALVDASAVQVWGSQDQALAAARASQPSTAAKGSSRDA